MPNKEKMAGEAPGRVWPWIAALVGMLVAIAGASLFLPDGRPGSSTTHGAAPSSVVGSPTTGVTSEPQK
jgi:hypothetical protein